MVDLPGRCFTVVLTAADSAFCELRSTFGSVVGIGLLMSPLKPKVPSALAAAGSVP